MNPIERLRQAAEVNWNADLLPPQFPFSPIQQMTCTDIARWILLNPDRSLNERIDGKQAVVMPTPVDEVALLSFFRYLQASPSESILAFMVAPEATAFSLLLGFSVLLQAVLNGVLEKFGYFPSGVTIPPGAGVLLISANQELTSRILRTHYGEEYLGVIYEILRMQTDGKMVPLDKAFKSASDAPWFASFSASRLELPTQLARTPSIVIVDLLPLRHRRRVGQLMEWIHTVAPTARRVVVAPEGDPEVDEWLTQNGALVCHLGVAPPDQVALAMGRLQTPRVDPLTAAWGHSRSAGSEPIYLIHVLAGLHDLETRFKETFDLIAATRHERYGIPNPMRRLHWIATDLKDLASPLGYYEMVTKHEGSVRDTITRIRRSVPINDWERQIFSTTLLCVADTLLSIYDYLAKRKLPPKAVVLKRLVDEIESTSTGNILILTPNRVAAKAISNWLDIEMSSFPERLSRIKVLAFQDYVQEKQLTLTDPAVPDHVIISAPIPRRHVSLLYGRLGKHLHFLVYPSERRLVQYALEQAHRNREVWSRSWIDTLCHLYGGLSSPELSTVMPRLSVQERIHRFVDHQGTQETTIELINEEDLDIQALMRLWQEVEGELEDDEERVMPSVTHRFVTTNAEDCVKAVCVELVSGARLLLAHDQVTQIYSKTEGELVNRTPDQITSEDVVVSIKSDAMRDLFQEVLRGVGRTPVMIALQGHMEQWGNILRKLYNKYADKRDPYLEIMRSIRAHGGQIQSVQSVRNWIRGRTLFLQDKRNVLAVCKAADVHDPKRSAEMIYKSMQHLWNFRRALGRKLGQLIRSQVSSVLDPGAPIDTIVEAPGGVRLSLGDLADAIEVHEVARVNSNIFSVPRELLGWVILPSEWSNLVNRRLVKEELDHE